MRLEKLHSSDPVIPMIDSCQSSSESKFNSLGRHLTDEIHKMNIYFEQNLLGIKKTDQTNLEDSMIDNNFYYDEDFAVQFDANLAEPMGDISSSPDADAILQRLGIIQPNSGSLTDHHTYPSSSNGDDNPYTSTGSDLSEISELKPCQLYSYSEPSGEAASKMNETLGDITSITGDNSDIGNCKFRQETYKLTMSPKSPFRSRKHSWSNLKSREDALPSGLTSWKHLQTKDLVMNSRFGIQSKSLQGISDLLNDNAQVQVSHFSDGDKRGSTELIMRYQQLKTREFNPVFLTEASTDSGMKKDKVKETLTHGLSHHRCKDFHPISPEQCDCSVLWSLLFDHFPCMRDYIDKRNPRRLAIQDIPHSDSSPDLLDHSMQTSPEMKKRRAFPLPATGFSKRTEKTSCSVKRVYYSFKKLPDLDFLSECKEFQCSLCLSINMKLPQQKRLHHRNELRKRDSGNGSFSAETVLSGGSSTDRKPTYSYARPFQSDGYHVTSCKNPMIIYRFRNDPLPRRDKKMQPHDRALSEPNLETSDTVGELPHGFSRRLGADACKAKKSVSFSENIAMYSPKHTPNASPLISPKKKVSSDRTGRGAVIATQTSQSDFGLEDNFTVTQIEKIGLIYDLMKAVEAIVGHVSKADPICTKQTRLFGVEHLLFTRLAPSLHAVLTDGLYPSHGDIVDVWPVVKASKDLDGMNARVPRVVEEAESNGLAAGSQLKFSKFVVEMAKHSLHEWLKIVAASQTFLVRFYADDALLFCLRKSLSQMFAVTLLSLRSLMHSIQTHCIPDPDPVAIPATPVTTPIHRTHKIGDHLDDVSNGRHAKHDEKNAPKPKSDLPITRLADTKFKTSNLATLKSSSSGSTLANSSKESHHIESQRPKELKLSKQATVTSVAQRKRLTTAAKACAPPKTDRIPGSNISSAQQRPTKVNLRTVPPGKAFKESSSSGSNSARSNSNQAHTDSRAAPTSRRTITSPQRIPIAQQKTNSSRSRLTPATTPDSSQDEREVTKLVRNATTGSSSSTLSQSGSLTKIPKPVATTPPKQSRWFGASPLRTMFNRTANLISGPPQQAPPASNTGPTSTTGNSSAKSQGNLRKPAAAPKSRTIWRN